MINNKYAIKTNDLSKQYGKIDAVANLDLNIEYNEIFGFLGPNGAGKTTTIRMLLDFISPTKGSAEVLGLDPSQSANKIMEEIGYISGEVTLYDNYNAKELLDYFENLHGKKSINRKSLVERFNLDESRKIGELSKGNKQKVSIIQAFMNNPKLLIVDEPTSGLDPLLQLEFYNLLQEQKDAGITVFISSHLLSEVQRVCDRIGIIKEGKLISVETISDMRKKNIYNIDLILKGGSNHSLNNLENITNLAETAGSITFTYNGDINNLIKELTRSKIQSLEIKEPDLEDLFMHYYKND